MIENAPLLSDEVTKRVKKLNTTLLADAMNGNGSMNFNIKPVSDDMVVVGTALTVELRPGDNLFLHQAIYMGSKGYVLVVDGKDHTENAYLGDLMANAAKAMEIEGIVVNGLVRDKNELKRLNFPIFAKGYIPSGPYKDGPGKINNVISCGNATVHPGDLVAGDANGVVVVPRESINEVLDMSEKKLTYEQNRLEKIDAFQLGKHNTSDIAPNWLESEMSKFNG
ncbi:diguanylate cyclase [Thalassobacillus devorans]|uniref:Putative 4-hydroxy-4-methyl-2-oxoglutarate aldolase n=1 Tax=Thalassobacillus devorans TaxID=279813 RepID=A0ABQ1P1E0_9BACI|nr:RraA family protein [Thalassobacillus devorans]NIK28077.1 regulator of RNase E activity RraA [Thalassobacillus devorans]GGC89040.1 diguanylate cyclase [Thalassobacillus devorans]